MNEITRARFLDRSWRFERNHDRIRAVRRGQRCHVANVLLARPCISPSISLIKRSLLENFQLALSFYSFFRTFSFQEEHPSLQFSLNPPLQLVSSTTLDTFLLFDTRTQSNPGPSRIHPSTSPRLNRGCWRLGTWIACLIRKKKKRKQGENRTLPFCLVPFSRPYGSLLGFFSPETSTGLTHFCATRLRWSLFFFWVVHSSERLKRAVENLYILTVMYSWCVVRVYHQRFMALRLF